MRLLFYTVVGFISADGDICNVQKPCKNGAQCTNIVGGYHCKCSGGFKGKNCDEGMCKKVRESAPKGLKKIRGAVKRTIGSLSKHDVDGSENVI